MLHKCVQSGSWILKIVLHTQIYVEYNTFHMQHFILHFYDNERMGHDIHYEDMTYNNRYWGTVVTWVTWEAPHMHSLWNRHGNLVTSMLSLLSLHDKGNPNSAKFRTCLRLQCQVSESQLAFKTQLSQTPKELLWEPSHGGSMVADWNGDLSWQWPITKKV